MKKEEEGRNRTEGEEGGKSLTSEKLNALNTKKAPIIFIALHLPGAERIPLTTLNHRIHPQRPVLGARQLPIQPQLVRIHPSIVHTHEPHSVQALHSGAEELGPALNIRLGPEGHDVLHGVVAEHAHARRVAHDVAAGDVGDVGGHEGEHGRGDPDAVHVDAVEHNIEPAEADVAIEHCLVGRSDVFRGVERRKGGGGGGPRMGILRWASCLGPFDPIQCPESSHPSLLRLRAWTGSLLAGCGLPRWMRCQIGQLSGGTPHMQPDDHAAVMSELEWNETCKGYLFSLLHPINLELHGLGEAQQVAPISA